MQTTWRLFGALLAALALTACAAQGSNPATQPGDRPSTPVTSEEPTVPPVNPKPCSSRGVGDSPRIQDMKVGEECFASLSSLKQVDQDTYELGLTCMITSAKDAQHTLAIHRVSDGGYGVTLTEEQDAAVTDKIRCEGDTGKVTQVSVGVTG